MPWLFSYGTLQQGSTQVATFGRQLYGVADALHGYRGARVPITDADVIARLGYDHHANVEHTGDPASAVHGTRLDVTEEELARADAYEAPFDYARAIVTLESGERAWVYVHRGS